MARLEQIAGSHQIDLVLNHLTWLDGTGLLVALSEPGAQDAFGQNPRGAIGVDVA